MAPEAIIVLGCFAGFAVLFVVIMYLSLRPCRREVGDTINCR